MKFRRLISLLIIAAIIIAFFTNPKEADFTKFLQPAVRRATAGPIVQYKNHLIYSIADVTYFTPTIDGNGKMVAAAGKEKYIGLFGRFWKVNN